MPTASPCSRREDSLSSVAGTLALAPLSLLAGVTSLHVSVHLHTGSVLSAGDMVRDPKRRRMLLEAALARFSAEGYEAATTRSIAEIGRAHV